MTIVEFLLARIAEDEGIARDAALDAGDVGFGEERIASGMAWNTSYHNVMRKRVRDDQTKKTLLTGAPLGLSIARHVALQDPARVLAECQAKRAIVELYDIQRSRRAAYRSPRSREIEDEQAALDRRMQEARTRPIEDAVRQLAAVYADHPDYDTTWRVT